MGGLSQNVIAGPPQRLRSKADDKHLLVLEKLNVGSDQTIASLRGYRPSRPPKYGTLVLTDETLIFCQKSRLGDSALSLRLSTVSAYEITRLMKQHSLKVYTPGLEYVFATRASLNDMNAFTSALQIRLKNSL